MRVWARVRLLGLGIAGVAIAGCGKQKVAEPKGPVPVQVETVRLQPWARTVTLTGEIRARVQSDLAFRVAGRIASRHVDVGDHVERGRTLATLEPRLQIADVGSAEAGVEAAKAALEKARADFRRQKELMNKGFTRRSTFDDAKEALASARAGLESATARRDTAKDSQDQTVLIAESSGIITARQAEVGQVVAAAQPIFSIALDGERDAVFDLYEDLIANKASPKIRVELLANRSVAAMGSVREVAPIIDPATNTVRVKVGLEKTPAEMALGAAVAGTGRFAPRDLVILPWTALSSAESTPTVWVVDRLTNNVTSRAVTIMAYRTGEVVVASGLKAGEIVVTVGGQLLWPGANVVPRWAVASAVSDTPRPTGQDQ
jgi:RND family efflux transporter MFP subunit